MLPVLWHTQNVWKTKYKTPYNNSDNGMPLSNVGWNKRQVHSVDHPPRLGNDHLPSLLVLLGKL
jgi:hypothetical protein